MLTSAEFTQSYYARMESFCTMNQVIAARGVVSTMTRFLIHHFNKEIGVKPRFRLLNNYYGLHYYRPLAYQIVDPESIQEIINKYRTLQFTNIFKWNSGRGYYLTVQPKMAGFIRLVIRVDIDLEEPYKIILYYYLSGTEKTQTSYIVKLEKFLDYLKPVLDTYQHKDRFWNWCHLYFQQEVSPELHFAVGSHSASAAAPDTVGWSASTKLAVAFENYYYNFILPLDPEYKDDREVRKQYNNLDSIERRILTAGVKVLENAPRVLE